MYLKFLMMGIASAILSTHVWAVEPKTTDTTSPMTKTGKDHLKLLQDVHQHNEVFDNYHTGAIPYENKK